MKFIDLVVIVTSVLGTLTPLQGDPPAEAKMDAMVKVVTGTCEWAATGHSEFKPLVEGTTLPSGSTVRTGSGGVVLFVPVRGCVSRLPQNSQIKVSDMYFSVSDGKVTLRKATIEVTTGNISLLMGHEISNDATDIRIITPDGVRRVFSGTVVVSVKEGKTTVDQSRGQPLEFIPGPIKESFK